MNIIGAGMAGLIAATMLRHHEPIVFEAASSLPNNHDALLRFRSDAVSKATGIPFKKVRVNKAIHFEGELHTISNLRFNNMYSQKVTGEIAGRSILNLESVDRYIAPPDFISRLAKNLRIEYGVQWNPTRATVMEPTISTIPMPVLMNMVKWNDMPKFNSRNIAVITFDIESPNVDVYQTIYFPGGESLYRASITGNHVMVEMADDQLSIPAEFVNGMAMDIMLQFGIHVGSIDNVNYKLQQYGKITPIEAQRRKQFILAMSDRYKVYSLGRFATWRQLLLDDLVPDIELIDQLITQRSSYSQHLSMARE